MEFPRCTAEVSPTQYQLSGEATSPQLATLLLEGQSPDVVSCPRLFISKPRPFPSSFSSHLEFRLHSLQSFSSPRSREGTGNLHLPIELESWRLESQRKEVRTKVAPIRHRQYRQSTHLSIGPAMILEYLSMHFSIFVLATLICFRKAEVQLKMNRDFDCLLTLFQLFSRPYSVVCCLRCRES